MLKAILTNGFLSAPGGQLVQVTNEWVGARDARIVLYDTDGVRSLMTATWLLQLGGDVHYTQRPAQTLTAHLEHIKLSFHLNRNS